VINVLGIDPSFRNFGVVAAQTNGKIVRVRQMMLIRPESKKTKNVRRSSDDLQRAGQIVRAMAPLYNSSRLIIAEIPSGSQSSRASLSSGICLGLLASAPLPIIQVTASEAKVIACGSKNASKRDMMDWAYEKYPDLDWMTYKRKGEIIKSDTNEHLADAIAIIHAGIETDQFRQLISILAGSSI
jgi:Holliday junction resolvasome RuvABC endonuclease subunit